MINKNRSYLENIDVMIHECREREKKLLAAREVIIEIAGKEPEPEVQREAEPFMTVKRTEPAKQPTPRKIDPEDKKRREAMRKEIMAMASLNEPITAAILFKKFGLDGAPKHRKQLIYQCLYDLKIAGDLEKEDGTNRYLITPSLPAPEIETSH